MRQLRRAGARGRLYYRRIWRGSPASATTRRTSVAWMKIKTPRRGPHP